MSADAIEIALRIQNAPSLSGAGLLGLVTAGMYSSPLSMYREYIQNAADAFSESGLPGKARVEIAINVNERRIRIRDNGPGLSRKEALERLLPIGRSDKKLGVDRGFRGVGRLAGLAFAKTVSFATRARGDQTVTRITWQSDRLPELTLTQLGLEEAILDCVDIATLPGSDYPEHFFEVEVVDVARHSAGLLLNRDEVQNYISEVCPVPLSSEFPFAERVEELFYDVETPLTLEVLLEGDLDPVERPYKESIRFSRDREAQFTEFQEVRIPSIDGNGLAALGWIAHSSYLGAVPKGLRVRGIRVRVGNIQVGGEVVFDDLFAEERFNRWCVGELHILDPRIIPNARRDYFEPGPHLRNLENQLVPVLQGVSTRCRQESTARNRAKKTLSALGTLEDYYALAISGFLTSEDSVGLVQEALREVDEVRKNIGTSCLDNGTLKRLERVEQKLNRFSVETGLRRFGDTPPLEVVAYQKVFGALATLAPSPSSARELIELIYAKASGEGQSSSGRDPDQESGSHFQARLPLDDHSHRH